MGPSMHVPVCAGLCVHACRVCALQHASACMLVNLNDCHWDTTALLAVDVVLLHEIYLSLITAQPGVYITHM